MPSSSGRTHADAPRELLAELTQRRIAATEALIVALGAVLAELIDSERRHGLSDPIINGRDSVVMARAALHLAKRL